MPKEKGQNFFWGTWIHQLIWAFNPALFLKSVRPVFIQMLINAFFSLQFQTPTYNDDFQIKYSQLFQFAQGKI